MSGRAARPRRLVGEAAPEGAWEARLLSMGTGKLLAMARNYLGPVKTPYDKREIVGRLVGFVRRPETRVAIAGLLDPVDARLVGALLLTGPLPEDALRDLFREDIRAFDFGLRLANLTDRLVLFEQPSIQGSHIAVNPLLAPDLARLCLSARVIVGAVPKEGKQPSPLAVPAAPATAGKAGHRPLGAALAAAFIGLLHHNPAGLRKGGILGKKVEARLSALLPELAADKARLDTMVRGLAGTGALSRGEGEGEEAGVDAAAFMALAACWGSRLPLRLAVAAAFGGAVNDQLVNAPGPDEFTRFLGAALSALPEGTVLPAAGLRRWIGIAALRAGIARDPALLEATLSALIDLGWLSREGGGSVRLEGDPRDSAKYDEVRHRRVFVTDGSHSLSVLPEAGLDDRIFALLVAVPKVYGKVWELELGRDSIRRAFGAGLEAGEIVTRLSAGCGMPLPQSLAFSIESWRDEYRSLRLFHGFVLVCDERGRRIVEGHPELSAMVAARLGDGVFAIAARSHDEIRSRFAEAGLELPGEIHAFGAPDSLAVPGSGPAKASGSLPEDFAAIAGSLWRELADAEDRAGEEGASDAGRESQGDLDPAPRLETLRALLVARAEGVPTELTRELSERIESRLILDAAQLERADVSLGAIEAGGLDYGGKTRIAERALRTRGDRLEIRYQLSGEPPVVAIVRPTRLEKTPKGIVLEGEDLSTGSPLRLPLGAASMVRRLRATPFGDEQ
ncbi:MAG: hypothetical protein ACOYM2_05100 [Rectinemataceae bacterium]